MAENKDKVFSNTVINWLIIIQSRPTPKPYKIREK